MKVMLTRG